MLRCGQLPILLLLLQLLLQPAPLLLLLLQLLLQPSQLQPVAAYPPGIKVREDWQGRRKFLTLARLGRPGPASPAIIIH